MSPYSWLSRFQYGSRYSYITEEFPDKNQFPRFYEAKRVEITLNPGDALYIPAGWFHWVFSEDPEPDTGLNVAINYWYNTIWSATDVDHDFPIKTSHNIHKTIDYLNFLKTFNDKKIYCSKSENKNGSFSLPYIRWIQNDTVKCTDEYLTWNEFYNKRLLNEKWYMWGNTDTRLEAYDPKILNNSIKNSNWWVNFGNVNTAMHFDSNDNILCQMAGRKRVILFPHSEWANLYLINPYPPEFIDYIVTLLNAHKK
jgi:hypothetical protein